MSVPLLLVRRKEGRGPSVPIQACYKTLVVEGLGTDGSVVIHGMDSLVLKENGRFVLPSPVNRGCGNLQAELIGHNNCATVYLE